MSESRIFYKKTLNKLLLFLKYVKYFWKSDNSRFFLPQRRAVCINILKRSMALTALTLIACDGNKSSRDKIGKVLHVELSEPKRLNLWVAEAGIDDISIATGGVDMEVRKKINWIDVKFNSEVSFNVRSVYVRAENKEIYINNKEVGSVTDVAISDDDTMEYGAFIRDFD